MKKQTGGCSEGLARCVQIFLKKKVLRKSGTNKRNTSTGFCLLWVATFQTMQISESSREETVNTPDCEG